MWGILCDQVPGPQISAGDHRESLDHLGEGDDSPENNEESEDEYEISVNDNHEASADDANDELVAKCDWNMDKHDNDTALGPVTNINFLSNIFIM